jgi:hypothetical protein
MEIHFKRETYETLLESKHRDFESISNPVIPSIGHVNCFGLTLSIKKKNLVIKRNFLKLVPWQEEPRHST